MKSVLYQELGERHKYIGKFQDSSIILQQTALQHFCTGCKQYFAARLAPGVFSEGVPKMLYAEKAREPRLLVSVRHAALADRLPFSSCVWLGKGFQQPAEPSMLKLCHVKF